MKIKKDSRSGHSANILNSCTSMFQDFIEFLQGKKTYTIGILGLVWAVTGLLMGWIDMATAQELILTSLGLLGLRAGFENALMSVIAKRK